MAGALVVKFGGSLLGSAERGALLATAARHGAVVVPGGGPFADAVRKEQRRQGFSDRAAHDMAILAMDQTALILADAEPRFALAATDADLAGAIADGRPAIWRPSPLALSADVPASWDVTSDSLAFWLAIRLAASRLVLLKLAPCPFGADIERLAADGVVDPNAPALARKFAGDVAIVGPATAAALERALSAPMRRAA